MRISGLQLFWMITSMEIGMTILMTFSPGFQEAKQDVWISVLLAGIISIIIALVTYRLCLLYPAQTFVQFSRTILGKWLGSFVVLIYIVQWYSIIPVVLRQYSDLIKLVLLQHTPVFVIMGIMVVLMMYAVFNGGIESVGRSSEVLGPIIIFTILLILLLSLQNVHFRNLLPVLADTGAVPVMKGALPIASYLGHAVELTMLNAFLQNPQKELRYGLWAVYFSLFIVIISIFMTILTVNPELSGIEWYPFFTMTSKINVADFIENMDAFVVIIWIASVFTKLSIYFFIACYGTAQWLNVKNWKVFIWILAPLMLALGLIPNNMIQSTTVYLNSYWVPWVLPMNMLLIPLFLLIVGKIRSKMNKPAN